MPVARLAAREARVLEQRPVEAEQGRRPFDRNSASARSIRAIARLAVDVVDDQLRDHRVVEPAHLVPGLDARVDAHAGPGRLAIRRDPPGRGQEALGDVLGVDAALDRVAAQHDVLLPRTTAARRRR